MLLDCNMWHTLFYQRVIKVIEDSVSWYLFHWPDADVDKSVTDESTSCYRVTQDGFAIAERELRFYILFLFLVHPFERWISCVICWDLILEKYLIQKYSSICYVYYKFLYIYIYIYIYRNIDLRMNIERKILLKHLKIYYIDIYLKIILLTFKIST